ncbi:MAG: polyprenyl synthetase family protein [Actinobacteria bacterium]|nr:polyprenyl synthetase family protein [Actinomycetota bacterium]
MSRVESRLRAVAATPDERLAELALHGIEAGGKRLRPALVVCAATAVGGGDAVGERVIDAATAVELLHLASLYHDDVLDAAPLRRGRPSVNALWGNHAAVLGGDVLLAHAYAVAASLGTAELRRLAHTLTALCSGQIAESAAQYDVARDLAHYDAAIRGKTATLLATSCWLGGWTAGASPPLAEALACFGMELGVAFQIVDDVLDLYGLSLQTGKAAGSDLRAGVFTLPVLMTLQRDPGLVELLTTEIDEDGVAEVGRRVRAAGADRRAIALALDHLEIAFGHLRDPLLLAEGVALLAKLAGLVVEPLKRLGVGGDGRIRAARRRNEVDVA